MELFDYFRAIVLILFCIIFAAMYYFVVIHPEKEFNKKMISLPDLLAELINKYPFLKTSDIEFKNHKSKVANMWTEQEREFNINGQKFMIHKSKFRLKPNIELDDDKEYEHMIMEINSKGMRIHKDTIDNHTKDEVLLALHNLMDEVENLLKRTQEVKKSWNSNELKEQG